MATRDAAAILKWHQALGTLEAGKRADLVVIDGTGGDPYDALIKAKETAIALRAQGHLRHRWVSALLLEEQPARFTPYARDQRLLTAMEYLPVPELRS